MLNGDQPLGIIAGGHDLPFEVIDALKASGRSYFLFGIKGEADDRVLAHPHMWVGWGQIGRLTIKIRQLGITELLFIGSISARPDYSKIRLDAGREKAAQVMMEIASNGGDEGVFGGIANFVEQHGMKLVSVPDVAPGLVVGSTLSIRSPSEHFSHDDVEIAAHAARMIGAIDAGQGVVVAAGRVLAMEGPEGTDKMLERVRDIKNERRAHWHFGQEGVLLKRARPGQDLRFDMPTIGPRTIEKAHEAGLAGIVCAEGEVLCANRRKSIETAERLGIFVHSRKLDDVSV